MRLVKKQEQEEKEVRERWEKYSSYVESSKESIPKQLYKLYSEYSLHDSKLLEIISSFERKTVNLEFQGWDNNLQNPLKYELKFLEVREYKYIFPKTKKFEIVIGDVSHWTMQLLDNLITVRIFFQSEVEFQISFEQFDFQATARDK